MLASHLRLLYFLCKSILQTMRRGNIYSHVFLLLVTCSAHDAKIITTSLKDMLLKALNSPVAVVEVSEAVGGEGRLAIALGDTLWPTSQ